MRAWRTDVANYEQVRYNGVYPGIDVVYRGNERQVEYDFVLAPHANPARIRMAFRGTQSMTLGKDGELILHTAAGDLVQPRPFIYQDVRGERKPSRVVTRSATNAKSASSSAATTAVCRW